MPRRDIEFGIPRVLKVDLSTGQVEVRMRPDLTSWLGGAGLGTKLLAEELKPEVDAFDPDQPIVFAIGPLTSAFPIATKTSAHFKSPLTGNLGESHAGGRLAMALRFAGYDAVILKGQARKPVYLQISSNDVRLRDATPLWGLKSEETGRVLRDISMGYGGGKRSIIRIGPAGEARVRFASVNVDTYRHFGRLGLGAVMGAKRLKAVIVGGDLSYPIADPKRYGAAYQKIYDLATRSSAMQKYHELGTPQNVKPLNALGGLPTRNLQAATFAEAGEISGESFAQENLLRKYSCFGCPVGCIHIGLLRQEFAKGYEFRSTGVSYDYELIFSLGSVIGVSDRSGVLALIESVEEHGLDAMSAGVVLAWLTEAQQKGLIPAEEMGVTLSFGDVPSYLKALDLLVGGRTEVWETARRGTVALAARYGGEFDLQLAGNEISGYHTGYGQILGHSVGARHSHLDNAGYSLDQSKPGADPRDLVDPLIKEETERCMLTSLHVCLFARKIYGDRENVREALGALGIDRTDAELDTLGRETLKLKHQLKVAMGWSLNDVRLPKRFFETPSPAGVLDEGRTRQALAAYGDRLAALLES
jgi:aldehyde:ferredoxin oxidoreductase